MRRNLSIPPFKSTTFNRIDDVSSDYKKIKRLFVKAKQPKYAPKGRRKQAKGPPVKFKVLDECMENVKKKAVIAGTFARCNTLQNLVNDFNLNYLIFNIYPDNAFSIQIKNSHRVQSLENEGEDYFTYDVRERSNILDYIDDEQVPCDIVESLFEYPEPLCYNYHCFALIQKFSSFTSDEPECSCFLLLKPTNLVYFKLTDLYLKNIPAAKQTERNKKQRTATKPSIKRLSQKYELKLILEGSGRCEDTNERPMKDLCLLPHSAPFEMTNYLQTYRNPFVTSLQRILKSSEEEEGDDMSGEEVLNERMGFVEDIRKSGERKVELDRNEMEELSMLLKNVSFPSCEMPEEKFHEFHGTVCCSFEDSDEELLSTCSLTREVDNILATRNEHSSCSRKFNLCETFSFELHISDDEKWKKDREVQQVVHINCYKLLVFKRSEIFYVYLTCEDKEEPLFPEDYMPLNKIGNRWQLAEYIQILSENFSSCFGPNVFVTIHHETVPESGTMFSISDSNEDLEECDLQLLESIGEKYTYQLFHMLQDDWVNEYQFEKYDNYREVPSIIESDSDSSSESESMSSKSSIHKDFEECDEKLNVCEAEKMEECSSEVSVGPKENVHIDRIPVEAHNVQECIHTDIFDTDDVQEILVAHKIESDTKIVLFEAHSFERSKRYKSFSSNSPVGKEDEVKRIEIYPSVKTEFVLTDKDIAQSVLDFDFGSDPCDEDICSFSKLISEHVV